MVIKAGSVVVQLGVFTFYGSIKRLRDDPTDGSTSWHESLMFQMINRLTVF
jgi:hypothetical protein